MVHTAEVNKTVNARERKSRELVRGTKVFPSSVENGAARRNSYHLVLTKEQLCFVSPVLSWWAGADQECTWPPHLVTSQGHVWGGSFTSAVAR